MQKKLEQFHCAFGHPIGREFKQEDLTLPASLINEEYQELVDACLQGDVANIKKELMDLMYVCFSMCVRYGWDADKMFALVHQSNMTKLDKNGTPVYREDGKIMKSDKYIPVDLTKL
jgi:NTP pyrophosphatase (non-canonical NTP hydrolase)